MRSSRVKSLTLALLLAAPPVWAQSSMGQPMPLGPPGQAEAEPAPNFIKVIPSPSLETTPVKPGVAGGHFEMEELKAPDLEAVGVLDDRQGGLGAGLAGAAFPSVEGSGDLGAACGGVGLGRVSLGRPGQAASATRL